MTPQVGEDWPVWWNTGRPPINGYYPARILEVRPYTGLYTQHFTHILKLEPPGIRQGWVEMSVHEQDRPA